MATYSLGRKNGVRAMAAKFKGTCRCCGVTIHPGERQWYGGKGFGVRCRPCGPHPKDTVPGNKQDQPGTKNEVKHTDPKPESKYKHEGFGVAPELADKLGIPTMGDRMPFETISLSNGVVVWTKRFESFQESMAYAWDNDYYNPDKSSTERGHKIFNEHINHRLNGQSRWLNRQTCTSVAEMFLKARSDAVRKIEAFKDRLTEDIVMPHGPRRQRRRHLDHGDEVNIDAWATGNPDMWERMEKVKAPNSKVVTIAINLSISCGKKRGDLLPRGAAAVALAEHLQSEGKAVEIVVVDGINNPTSDVLYSNIIVPIKRANQQVDFATIVATCAEIDWFRSVMVVGVCRGLPGDMKEGYGTPRKMMDSEKEQYDFLIDADVVGEDKAAQWLDKVMKEGAETC